MTLLVSQSRLYTRTYETVSPEFKVYDTRNGELLHTIKLPKGRSSAATNGRELYFHFLSPLIACGEGDPPPFIRAYPLPKY